MIDRMEDFRALDPFFRIIEVSGWRDYLDPLRVFAALESRPLDADAAT